MLPLLSENPAQANYGNTGGAMMTELTSHQRGLSLTHRGDVIMIGSCSCSDREVVLQLLNWLSSVLEN